MDGHKAWCRLGIAVLVCWLIPAVWSGADGGSAAQTAPSHQSRSPWLTLITQASALGLPTRFLRQVPHDFVTLEFEDLQRYAAEYDPEQHRMVLNRSLSFNAAGGVLRPLSRLTHQELGTLYHELFHAYMDYIRTHPARTATHQDMARLLILAQQQRRCRYEVVLITPIIQRKSATELRLLTEHESWEALNETWAVFVGWAIWTTLQLDETLDPQGLERPVTKSEWLTRLHQADREGLLIGYYEPEDPAERAVTQKRYLAPSHRISPQEVSVLLEVLFEETPDAARRAAAVMQPPRPSREDDDACRM